MGGVGHFFRLCVRVLVREMLEIVRCFVAPGQSRNKNRASSLAPGLRVVARRKTFLRITWVPASHSVAIMSGHPLSLLLAPLTGTDSTGSVRGLTSRTARVRTGRVIARPTRRSMLELQFTLQ